MESAFRAYRSVWSVIAGAALALGLVISTQILTVAELVCVLIATVLIGNACALSYATVDSMRWRNVILAGPVLALITLATIGLVGVFEVVGLTLMVGLAVASPWLIGLLLKVPGYVGRERGAPTLAVPGSSSGPSTPTTTATARVVPLEEWMPRAVMPDMVDPLEVADVLDDLELCNAWHNSYLALQRAESPAARLEIVALRKLYLDSFERRDPRAFRAWMASGGRAAGDLSRYLLHE